MTPLHPRPSDAEREYVLSLTPYERRVLLVVLRSIPRSPVAAKIRAALDG